MQDIVPPQRGQLHSASRPVLLRSRMTYDRVRTQTTTDTYTIEQQQTILTRLHAEPATIPSTIRRRRVLPKIKKPIATRFLTRRLVFSGLALALLVTTAYVAVDTWTTNNQVKAELNPSDASGRVASVEDKSVEGSDQTTPTKDVLSEYVVAADQPRALYINKISIAARILPMGVNADSSVQAPRNIFDAGWYTSSAKPGNKGATFIDGHASGATREGLFAYLDTLKEGDQIGIEKGNGDQLKYIVRHVEIISLDTVDMNKMLAPYGDATRGLNIMTCTGKWVQATKTYDHRVLVFAEQVS